MICECGKQLTIETALLPKSHEEVEVSYCDSCKILWEFDMAGFEYKEDD